MSIWEAKPTLQSGCRWQVGCCSKIKIWKDCWLSVSSDFRVRTSLSHPSLNDMTVESMLDERGHWDTNTLQDLFMEADVQDIMAIPLSLRCPDDKVVWHYDKKGEFLVKVGTRLHAGSFTMSTHRNLIATVSNHFKPMWTRIWNAFIPLKIRVGVWRITWNASIPLD